MPSPIVRQAAIFLCFLAGYVLLGIAGMQLQSAQPSPEDALHAADSVCCEAKHAGRNPVWIHSDSSQAAEL